VVEISRKPTVGGVTDAATITKLTFMSIIFGVAGITILRGSLQVRNTTGTNMAGSAVQLSVFPSQLEGDIAMAEIVTIGIDPIMTSQAVLSICLEVG
jgi:hypothetical protein